jgi:hypothetical protein
VWVGLQTLHRSLARRAVFAPLVKEELFIYLFIFIRKQGERQDGATR